MRLRYDPLDCLFKTINSWLTLTFIMLKFCLNFNQATARRKLTLSLLVLPMPYNLNTEESYPHSGSLSDDAFRKPWIRGKTLGG